MAHHPYQEVRDNLIDARMRPNDLLRSKLSFFGAQRFDPKSDRFLRVSLFPYAPFPDEINRANADDWAFPPLAAPAKQTITVSLNEIDATVKKAARGGGYSWGLAEEAGRAVRWLEARRLPGLEAMLRHLESGTMTGSPILAGAAFADQARSLARGEALKAEGIAEPLLVLPFVATAARIATQAADLVWGNVRFRALGDGATLAGRSAAIEPGIADLTLGPARGTIDGFPLTERIAGITIDRAIWSGLEHFAMKTYVPASPSSRLRGAGTGTDGSIDND
jgi:hypothetical protein